MMNASAAAPPALRVQELRFAYPDGTLAIDGLSLEVTAGERVAIVGANGAGKSTLLLLLAGILSGQGLIEIGGLRLEKKNLRAIRQRLGLVFQNPDDQLFCPTVYDDIAFGPRNSGLAEPAVRERVRRALAAVGLAAPSASEAVADGDGVLEWAARKSAFHLSLGQKKRVALATVLALEAAILAFDEPTSSLDPRGRREIRQLLGAVGGTQLIVTHDLGLVRELCDRVLIFAAGRIAAAGPPAQLLADQALLERHGLH